jgi:hypothetical protein
MSFTSNQCAITFLTRHFHPNKKQLELRIDRAGCDMRAA